MLNSKSVINSKIKAFTLVELLVVVVIIGILSTLVVVGLSSASNKAKDAKTKSAVESVTSALQMILTEAGNLSTINSTCAATSTLVPVTGACKTAIENAVGVFSSPPVAADNTPVKIRIPISSQFIVSGKASSSTGCFWTSFIDKSGLNTPAPSTDTIHCW